MNYKNIFKSTNTKEYSGGYKNVFLFAPRRDFLSISRPPDNPPMLGDGVSITGAHAFDDPKGFLSYDAKQHSVTLKSATVGEDGAQELEHTAEFSILGDSATTQEQLQRILNDDIICLLKEASCLENDSYVQLGDECVSPVFKVEFDGKTTKEGLKEYKISVVTKAKYFYSGAVVMSTETED